MGQHQPFALAVGRDIGDAGVVGRLDIGEDSLVPADDGAFRRGREGAVEAEEKILLPLADQAADADDFAGAGVKIEIADHAGPEAFDPDALLAGHRTAMGREQAAGIAADHQADESLGIDAGKRLIGGDGAVLQHRDVRTERAHLVQPVGDEQERHPLVAQPADEIEENMDFVRRQRRGRLVEYEDSRLAEERLGNLDHLLAAERQLLDRHVGRLGEADEVADLAHLAQQRIVVDQSHAPRIGAEPDILGDRQARRQAQLLLDHRDAASARVGGRKVMDGLAVDDDFAAVRREHAGQQIDEGRLAGAVLTEQRVDATGSKRDVHVLQHRVAEEALRHGPGLCQGREVGHRAHFPNSGPG